MISFWCRFGWHKWSHWTEAKLEKQKTELFEHTGLWQKRICSGCKKEEVRWL